MSPVLSPDAVRVGARAATKDEAIELVGRLLVEQGLVTDAYLPAMHARETVVSTYLGNGIAIPHGTSESTGAILATGLAVVQFPDGVPWDDERATLVIGIAARNEEHVGILSRLATILEDEAVCARLSRTVDAAEIHRALTADPEAAGAPVPPDAGTGAGTSPAAASRPDDDGVARRVVVTNPAGLHARPAAQIVARMQGYAARVTIVAGPKEADARSITGLLALGASRGDEVTVRAAGPDAAAALAAVLEIAQAERDR